ncbi:hypothetical protein SEA_WATERT_124 [Microbacterium phage WaterT]|nr:hypothetical protein SEA_WATERT_2 [Microbacterium phage WaterT]QDK01391.1 hypothetical protein SEA_WATERT_124 [Microbacterium phage WaterT]
MKIPGTDVPVATNATEGAYDVWLKFYAPDELAIVLEPDDEAEYEANVFPVGDFSNPVAFEVQWYHNEVGQVHYQQFPSYSEAVAWLERQDFSNFSA